jgi:hypothetical protein
VCFIWSPQNQCCFIKLHEFCFIKLHEFCFTELQLSSLFCSHLSFQFVLWIWNACRLIFNSFLVVNMKLGHFRVSNSNYYWWTKHQAMCSCPGRSQRSVLEEDHSWAVCCGMVSIWFHYSCLQNSAASCEAITHFVGHHQHCSPLLSEWACLAACV